MWTIIKQNAFHFYLFHILFNFFLASNFSNTSIGNFIWAFSFSFSILPTINGLRVYIFSYWSLFPLFHGNSFVRCFTHIRLLLVCNLYVVLQCLLHFSLSLFGILWFPWKTKIFQYNFNSNAMILFLIFGNRNMEIYNTGIACHFNVKKRHINDVCKNVLTNTSSSKQTYIHYTLLLLLVSTPQYDACFFPYVCNIWPWAMAMVMSLILLGEFHFLWNIINDSCFKDVDHYIRNETFHRAVWLKSVRQYEKLLYVYILQILKIELNKSFRLNCCGQYFDVYIFVSFHMNVKKYFDFKSEWLTISCCSENPLRSMYTWTTI